MVEWKTGAGGLRINSPVSREEAERILGKRFEDIPRLQPLSHKEIEKDLQDPEFRGDTRTARCHAR